MAALECNNTSTGSFNNSSAENGDALPEEKSLSIDYSEDLWLANSEDSSGPYAQQSNKAATDTAATLPQTQAVSYAGTISNVAARTAGESVGVPVTVYQPAQQHWNQIGEHHDDGEGGTILQPSATTYINGNLEQNGMEFNNSSGDEKDFAQLVPAGTYVEAAVADAQNKTFTALMPAAGLGVNGEEIQGGFTTMLQDGQQQMVFYGSGEQVNADSSQMISQQNIAYEHSSNQMAVIDSQDGSVASGEEGAGEGNLYVAMDNAENGQQVAQGENYTLIAPAVLSNMENVKMDGEGAYATPPLSGNFQNISTLPFVQNGAFAPHTTFSNFGPSGAPTGAPGNNCTPDHLANSTPGNVTQEVGAEYHDQSAIEYEQEEVNSDNSNMGEASEFVCQVCQEGFEDQASLNSHMENHPPLKSFICETCTKSFATRRYLKYHRKNHCKRASSYEGRSESEEAYPNAEVKRFSCNVCSRPFRVLKCMKVHKKKKHGIIKDFTCPNCAITFASPQQLTDHACQPKSPIPNQESQQRVSGITPPPPPPTTPFMSQRKKKKLRQVKPTCDICGKVFGDRISLDIHRVKHIEEEFYPCDMCAVDTQSDNPTHLAVHFRIKFFTDDNQHILEDQKAAVEAMRVEDMISSPLSAHTPIHAPSTPNSAHTPLSSSGGPSLHPHQQQSPASATVYSNPSSIIATAAACTNIINHTQDGVDGQYLEQARNLNSASGDFSSTIKAEPMLSNYSAVIPGQSSVLNMQQPPSDAAVMAQAYAEYSQDAVQHQKAQNEGVVTKTVIRSKPHICDICNKSFAEPTKLELHYKTNHLEDRPFQCDICDKSFFTKWKLQRHMLSHLENKPHSCPACSKSFVERGKLEAHYRTHLGTKPYKCEHCAKAFTVKSQLTIHVRRIHSADQPFGCEICGKAFLWKSGLEKHMRKHTREKPYNCTICAQKYSQKSNLISHLAKVHNEHPQPEQIQQYQQQQQPEEQQQQLDDQPKEEEEDEEEGEAVEEMVEEDQIQEGQIQEGQIQEGQIQEGQIQEGQIQEGQIQEGQIQDVQDQVMEN